MTTSDNGRTPDDLCDECGKPRNTFACKVQHIQINSGACKAAND